MAGSRAGTAGSGTIMSDFQNATPDMKNAYYVVMKRHYDKTIMMHSPPYQTIIEMDAAMAEAESFIDNSVLDMNTGLDGGVFLDCYWVGENEPEDEL
jgi:hypothetical protein